MVIGTIGGSEAGVQAIEILKKGAHVELVVGTVSIIVFTGISIFCAWESWMALRMNRPDDQPRDSTENRKQDVTAIDGFAKALQRIKLAPHVSLPHSGIDSISFWAILFVSFIGGIFSGFLGGGAGYIRMPSMVYLLGIPTHIAVGTDLFEIIISASYGTIRHAMNGNVDIVIALVMQTGAALGRPDRSQPDAIFYGPAHPSRVCPASALGCHRYCSETSHQPSSVNKFYEDSCLQRRFGAGTQGARFRSNYCQRHQGRDDDFWDHRSRGKTNPELLEALREESRVFRRQDVKLQIVTKFGDPVAEIIRARRRRPMILSSSEQNAEAPRSSSFLRPKPIRLPKDCPARAGGSRLAPGHQANPDLQRRWRLYRECGQIHE